MSNLCEFIHIKMSLRIFGSKANRSKSNSGKNAYFTIFGSSVHVETEPVKTCQYPLVLTLPGRIYDSVPDELGMWAVGRNKVLL